LMRSMSLGGLLVVVAVAGLFVAESAVSGQPVHRRTEELEWSVVRVAFEHETAPGTFVQRGGSAVLVSRFGWFATAGHLFRRDEHLRNPSRVAVAWPDGRVSDGWRRRCYTLRPDLGWFLIPELPQEARPLPIAPRVPTRLSPLRIVGYPAAYPGTFDVVGSPRQVDVINRDLRFRLDTTVELSGLSGGAILGSDGLLLAVYVATLNGGPLHAGTLLVGERWCE